ncbi:Cation channel sperm-associated auxiliary subunit delta [Lemmus lemmus]
MTMDNFESSLPPLVIPKKFSVGMPLVTSAFFAPGSIVLFVVNKKVYIYNYIKDSWSNTQGIQAPVSHISGDSCCFNNKFCLEIANNIFVYLRGDYLPGAKIYFSDNGGFSFQDLDNDSLNSFTGLLGGIFFFHSLSQVGILVVKSGMGTFHYLEHPLNHSAGVPFTYNENLDVLIKPGQRGFLVLYGQLSLFVSPNAGQIVQTVELWKGKKLLFSDITSVGFVILSLASNTFELAVLTQTNQLYYGSQSYLKTPITQLPDPPGLNNQSSISFTDTGMLEILTPVYDQNFPAFDFQKCTVNVQALLMEPKLEIEPCNVEVLESTMVNRMYTIDMNTKLDLSVLMIPRRGKTPIPLVMVSNPHSLGFEAHTTEFGNTFDGNIKHKLKIELRQQHHWKNADLNFTSSIKNHAISSLTVDIADKTMACVDLKPLTTLISVGCDQTKKIIVQNKISACTMGILDPVELQKNYSYTIEKEAYRPVSHEVEAQADLLVYYQYKDLGCPRLVYYDKPWKPVVELYCSLNTIFSVYVYGALPVAMLPPVLSITLLVVATLLSIWLAYAVPKELSTERGQRFKDFCSGLWGRLRQCLRSRKVKDQPGELQSQVQ